MKFMDLTGMKFNRLTVIEREFCKASKRTLWKCKCDCGKVVVVDSYKLRNGLTKSCGCFNKEQRKKFINKCVTHNKTHHPLYHIYNGMKARCYRKNNNHYKYYGGNGIKVCDEWLGKHGFMNFYKWSYEHGYRESDFQRNKLSIDRIDVNGDYSPDNCRWVDNFVQANNKTDNRLIEYNGETKTITEWCRILCLNYPVMEHRVREYGIPLDKAMNMPSGKPVVRFNGSEILLEKLCRDNKIKYKDAIYLLVVNEFNGEQILDSLKEG